MTTAEGMICEAIIYPIQDGEAELAAAMSDAKVTMGVKLEEISQFIQDRVAVRVIKVIGYVLWWSGKRTLSLKPKNVKPYTLNPKP